MKRTLLFICLIFCCSGAFADTVQINNFIVRENPFRQSEIAIVAADSLKNPREDVNGQFAFTINGFETTLKFDRGVAFYDHKIDRSTFLYARHVNDSGTHSMLYYVYKSDKLTCLHISWILLLAIPVALILLGYMFKRFMIAAIVLFVVFFFFNHHAGLSIPTFFESIIDGLKNIF